VTVTGLDLELCESVAAETNGWPCGATLVAKTAETTPFSLFQPGGALRTLNVRVYPPTLNGALVPAPLFGGGGDAKDWSRVVVALRGDFGDARVAVRVEDAPVSRRRRGADSRASVPACFALPFTVDRRWRERVARGNDGDRRA
jgi:hypothetical protein